jgi:hypothetical protein
MFWLLSLHFAIKSYYKLAEIHFKNKRLYAILGAIVFCVGCYLGICLLNVFGYIKVTKLSDLGDYSINLISMPFGILVTWVVYRLLVQHWKEAAIWDHNDFNIKDNNNFR